MAQINDNDNSDLLILSEDDSNSDSLIIDDNINNDNNLVENELISFDDDSSNFLSNDNKIVEDTISTSSLLNDISLENNELKNNKLNLDSDFTFENSDTEVIEDSPTLELIDDNNSLEILPDTSLTQQNDILSNDFTVNESTNILDEGNSNFSISDVSSVGTMVDILDRAMHELTSRTDVIIIDIKTEEDYISDLKSQILDLESKVSISELKVSDLNKEKNMITKNIKSLEKMKLIDNTNGDLQKNSTTKSSKVS